MRLKYFRGNVFVANLPPEYSDESLAEAFDSFGMVLSASVARDPETGKRLRYGFVDIATPQAADAAVKGMNGQELDGHRIEVKLSERPSAGPKGGSAARRPASRPQLVARPSGAEQTSPAQDGEPVYTVPLKAPSFQVERRVLPRRLVVGSGRA